MSAARLGLCAVLALAACGDDAVPGALDAGVDAGPADAAPRPLGDGLPQGAVSFFRATACPPGWAVYSDGAHRTIVPSPDDVGLTRGLPLSSGAPLPTHGHAGAASVELPDVSYVGAGGGGNGGVAPAGATGFGVAIQPASPDLPYLQLLVCRKTDAPDKRVPPAPPGLLTFFVTPTCPPGWTAADDERRFLVGLPEGGTPGATFGGAPLGSGEQRGHGHTLAGQVTTQSHGIALASGCCAGGYAQNGTHAFAGTGEAGEAVLPYVQLRLCRKD
jgi:hypothetical protein